MQYDYPAIKTFDDGRIAAVMPLLEGRARIVLARNEHEWRTGYNEAW